MQDRQPGAPGQYRATLTAAEFQKMQSGEQFTIIMIRDDQPIVEGTPYSKAAVLPDELAALICPDVLNPTPADALAALLPRRGTVPMAGDLPMDGHRVKGVAAPVEDGDAVNLGYVNGNFAPAVETADHPGCYYRTVNGIVEWINPPMINGVEYRTTERNNEDIIYAKLVDFGALPNDATKTISIGGAMKELIGIEATALSSSNAKISIPYFKSDGTLGARYHITDNNSIVMITYGDMSSYSGKFLIRYTK